MNESWHLVGRLVEWLIDCLVCRLQQQQKKVDIVGRLVDRLDGWWVGMLQQQQKEGIIR